MIRSLGSHVLEEVTVALETSSFKSGTKPRNVKWHK